MRPRPRLLPTLVLACALGMAVVVAALPEPPRSDATVPAAAPAGEGRAPEHGDVDGEGDLSPPPPQAGLARAPSADESAGLLSREVPPRGTGQFRVAPGTTPAPGKGTRYTVRAEVEEGVPVDPGAFAAFVMATLNDPRGWGHGGAATFARTDGEADFQVMLGSPETTTELCRPLDTRGTLSCRNGPRAIITHYRWVNGHPDYRGDLAGYRRYVINHEVGHVLGHGHVPCPGAGQPAPVMQQQTLGLLGCTPNPWPFP